MKYSFAFDLDGTITKKEVLPIIAKEVGIEEEMAILTKRTMDGEIPFDQSFTHRVNMLKSIPISRVQNIVQRVPLSHEIVQFIRKNRGRCYIVTGNLDVWIKLLVEKIDANCLCSYADFSGDSLLGIKKIIRKKDVHAISSPIVAIGEGNNDVEMLEEAAISIGYGGVHDPAPSVLEVVDYAIYSDIELCRFLKQLS